MHKGIHVALFPVAKADEKRRVSTMRGGFGGAGRRRTLLFRLQLLIEGTLFIKQILNKNTAVKGCLSILIPFKESH